MNFAMRIYTFLSEEGAGDGGGVPGEGFGSALGDDQAAAAASVGA